jgi:hypothetical protein
VSVIGVPKTIDIDILLMDKTFGFDTAVEEAQRAINSAYIEVNYLLIDQFDKIKYCFLFGKYHHIYVFSSFY